MEPLLQLHHQQKGINWLLHYKRRELALQVLDECPRYLLAPEIDTLLSVCDDLTQRTIIQLLFVTGARISELLALTPEDVHINNELGAYVILRTLKQQRRGKGRIPNSQKTAKRIVPILDQSHATALRGYIVTMTRNKRKPIFTVSDETVRNWLKACHKRINDQGLNLPVTPTPHVMRHSFAVHLVLNGVHIRKISQWLGHKSLKSTMIYTRLLTFDAAIEEQGIAFSVPVNDNPLLSSSLHLLR